jgi:hypothetical protein
MSRLTLIPAEAARQCAGGWFPLPPEAEPPAPAAEAAEAGLAARLEGV